MSRLEGLKDQLKPGKVYRRQELGKWSKSIDRDLDALLKDDSLKKLSHGLYYHPKQSAFGDTKKQKRQAMRLVQKFVTEKQVPADVHKH